MYIIISIIQVNKKTLLRLKQPKPPYNFVTWLGTDRDFRFYIVVDKYDIFYSSSSFLNSAMTLLSFVKAKNIGGYLAIEKNLIELTVVVGVSYFSKFDHK